MLYGRYHQNIKKRTKIYWLMKRKINCEKARSFSIVKALENLGHFPIKESEKEAWFLSVLRSETQASFKVSKTLNRWYDHGLGKGGNVIDLVVLILKCSVQEALEFLANENPIFSFQQQQVILTHVPKVDQETKNKISLLQTKKIEHPALLQYLHSRKIPKEIARNYCSEVWYQYKEKTFFAIGLKNHLGGVGNCATNSIKIAAPQNPIPIKKKKKTN